MSAENGIPVDKCPKCGMIRIKSSKAVIGFACQSYFIEGEDNHHEGLACKRIAWLQEQLETKDKTVDELVKECESKDAVIENLQEHVKRLTSYQSLEALIHAFDVGRSTLISFDEYKQVNKLTSECAD